MAMVTPSLPNKDGNSYKAYTKARNMVSLGQVITDNDMTHWDRTPPVGFSLNERVAVVIGIVDEKANVPWLDKETLLVEVHRFTREPDA